VLGPTDPKDAPAGSLRGLIYSGWKDLGLSEVPNVGDNGVHASASPFEAMAERMNWLGSSLSEDSFGRSLLASGVGEGFITDGTVDPQVALADGSKGSLFDALEDMDSSACAAKVGELAKLAPAPNCAFVFIKPHANTEAARKLTSSTFAAKGIRVLREGTLTGETIDEKKLIDQHYYAIASKATILKPAQLCAAAASRARVGVRARVCLRGCVHSLRLRKCVQGRRLAAVWCLSAPSSPFRLHVWPCV
jgi:hypothetical protein